MKNRKIDPTKVQTEQSKSVGKYLQIRSRHPSHDVIRGKIRTNGKKIVFRLGSSTEDGLEGYAQINRVEAIKNSASKLRMKYCFNRDGVKTADWWTFHNNNVVERGQEKERAYSDLPYPIVVKHIYGSRGEGNYIIRDQKELVGWLKGKTPGNYIIERFYNYNREYRLHVTKDGCFYTCRKMLKTDTPEDKRWFRNDSNSVWIVEENAMFDRPINWAEIEEQCVKALVATGLDIGACDVRVQSAMVEGQPRKNVDFIIIEINSAPSFGEVTAQKYIQKLNEMVSQM